MVIDVALQTALWEGGMEGERDGGRKGGREEGLFRYSTLSGCLMEKHLGGEWQKDK